MDARSPSAAGTRPQDWAEDRRALREMKEESDHLEEVVGEARDAVRDAERVAKVGTEQPSGQAETGVVGGDAKKAHGSDDEDNDGNDGNDGNEDNDDDAAAVADRPDADTHESQKSE